MAEPTPVKKPAALKAYKPSLRERAQIGMEGLYTRATGREPGYAPRRLMGKASELLDFIPGVGDVIGIDETKRALDRRQYLEAGLTGAGTMLGVVPIVGDVAGKALKGAAKPAQQAVEKLAAKYDVEAPAMVKRYGPKQVPEAVDMLAKKLRERGANPKIGKPYTTPHGTSVYLYPSETIDAYTPQLRISDHSGGWGANRGPVKPGGFDLSTEMSEAELNAAVDAAISSPSGRAFWDADNLKAETTAAYQAAVDQAKATAPDRALAAYMQLVGKGSANSIKRATSQARTYDINFMPPKPPAKPKAPGPAAQDLGAKYGLPEFTTDLTPAQIEANLAAHMSGSKTPPVLYHGTGVWEHEGRKLGDIEQFNRNASVDVVKRKPSFDTVGVWMDESPSSAHGAGMYAGSEGAVYPLHARITNPWVPKDFREFRNLAEKDPEGFRDRLKAQGFDGIVFPAGEVDSAKQGPVWVAFEPTQVKSTMNRGTFDPNEPHLSKARGGLVEKYAEGGPVVPGNIDLHNRPVVRNPDDSISTVLSITVGFGDKTYVLPRVVGGKVVSNQEAIDHFRQTGEHLGAYDKQKDAEDYSQRLHEEQAKEYKDKARGGLVKKYGVEGYAKGGFLSDVHHAIDDTIQMEHPLVSQALHDAANAVASVPDRLARGVDVARERLGIEPPIENYNKRLSDSVYELREPGANYWLAHPQYDPRTLPASLGFKKGSIFHGQRVTGTPVIPEPYQFANPNYTKEPSTVAGYRPDPTGKFGGKDGLETMPTKLDEYSLYSLVRDMAAVGGPRIPPEQILAMALKEGRTDLGSNGVDSTLFANSPAKRRQAEYRSRGIDLKNASTIATIAWKADEARRVNKPFYQVWNGTGTNRYGQTGADYAKDMQNYLAVAKHPKNKTLLDQIKRAQADGQKYPAPAAKARGGLVKKYGL